MYNQLELWRIAIGLIKKTKRFPSPFRNADYHWHLIEPEILLPGRDAPNTPDIVSTKKDNWVIMDLTLSPDKDWNPFKSIFSSVSGSIIAQISSPHYSRNFKKPPDLLVIGSEDSVTLSKCFSEDISGLVVLPKVDFFHCPNTFTDSTLKRELDAIKGLRLKHPPTSILAVPELHGVELKKAIKAVVLKYAATKNNNFSATDVANSLLMDEVGFFSNESRLKLIDAVNKKLKRLSAEINKLKKPRMITYNQQKDSFSLRYSTGAQSKTKLETLLSKWSETPGITQESLQKYL